MPVKVKVKNVKKVRRADKTDTWTLALIKWTLIVGAVTLAVMCATEIIAKLRNDMFQLVQLPDGSYSLLVVASELKIRKLIVESTLLVASLLNVYAYYEEMFAVLCGLR